MSASGSLWIYARHEPAQALHCSAHLCADTAGVRRYFGMAPPRMINRTRAGPASPNAVIFSGGR